MTHLSVLAYICLLSIFLVKKAYFTRYYLLRSYYKLILFNYRKDNTTKEKLQIYHLILGIL